MKFLSSLLVLTVLTSTCFAKLKVVATTADIAALIQQIGADKIDATSIAKGSQDPHFLEAKPSFMVRIRDANLVVSNGLSLEIGWLPNLIRGARNPKVLEGTSGNMILGSMIDPIDLPSQQISRAMGDVHPEGNPHFMLDPIVVSELGLKVAERLGELDPGNQEFYKRRARDYQEKIRPKIVEWQSRISKSGIKQVVTYHPSMNYFLKRFDLQSPLHLEAKPGVPPSAKHILKVIETMKNEKIRIMLVDNFFDTKIADRVKREVPEAKVFSVGISVGSKPDLTSMEDVIEQLVKFIEEK